MTEDTINAINQIRWNKLDSIESQNSLFCVCVIYAEHDGDGEMEN